MKFDNRKFEMLKWFCLVALMFWGGRMTYLHFVPQKSPTVSFRDSQIAASRVREIKRTEKSKLYVRLSPLQPSRQLAPRGIAYLPVTAFDVTAEHGDVALTTITVERVGLASDATVEKIRVLENGYQIGKSASLASDHQAHVPVETVIASGTTRHFLITVQRVNQPLSQGGQTLGFALRGIDASVRPLGEFPLIGTLHTVNESLDIGAHVQVRRDFPPEDYKAFKAIQESTQAVVIAMLEPLIGCGDGNCEDIRLQSIRFRYTGNVSFEKVSWLTVYPIRQNGSQEGRYIAERDDKEKSFIVHFPERGFLNKPGVSFVFIAVAHLPPDLKPDERVTFEVNEGDMRFLGETYSYEVASHWIGYPN